MLKSAEFKIKDIIDIEYFFYSDKNLDESELDERDRKYFFNEISPVIKTKDRKSIIKKWLEIRRNAESAKSDSVLPGTAYHEIYNFIFYFLIFLGIFLGSGSAFSFLIYKGSEPLNVASFFGIFVLTQILMIVILCLFLLIRKKNNLMSNFSIFFSLLNFISGKFPAKDRNSFHAAIGIIKIQKNIYGQIFYWPFFIVLQIFGVCFNIGVLLAIFLRIIASDVAFGWQSTIQTGAQTVYIIVKIISAPWLWFCSPPIAHPTIEQIEGSRLILKEGIYHLSTSNLVSWWPFLCFSVLFYALIPRLLLFLTGFILNRRALKKLNFETPNYDKLMARLITPLINTQGLYEDTPAVEEIMNKNYSPIKINSIPKNNLVALIPTDIVPQFPKKEAANIISKLFGVTLWKSFEIDIDLDEDSVIIDSIADAKWEGNTPNLLIILEAWRPPIKQTINFIAELRKNIGAQSKIGIGLIGKPSESTIFTKPKPEEIQVWTKAIEKLGDAYIRIENFIGENK
ncbi:MAG: DUF2868 domain-containing protein [Desulfobacterales bacterium]|nr:DUF2868 domain-containing protein [Desulfobacterales bacterium]